MSESQNWQSGITALAEQGLNIFASTRVADLPEDIQDIFQKQKVPVTNDQTLCVIGHGGKTMWEKLPRPWVNHHPVDSFAVDQVRLFNETFINDETLQVLYPHSHLQIPLQRLGRFLNICKPSLLGMDISPEFGPWFAFRAVFVTSLKAPKIHGKPFESPCLTCVERPCRTACPISAVKTSAGDFKLSECLAQRLAKSSPCATHCFSRVACPVGSEHRYTAEQQGYHMQGLAYIMGLKK